MTAYIIISSTLNYEITSNTLFVTQVMVMKEIILCNNSNCTVNYYNDDYIYQVVLNFNFYCFD